MWKSRLNCGLLCKNKIVTIFLLLFYTQNGTYLKKHASYIPRYSDGWMDRKIDKLILKSSLKYEICKLTSITIS